MVNYRRLQSSDVELMRQLNVVFADAFEDHETHLSRKPSDAYLTSLLSKKHFVTLIAFNGSVVVGGLIAYALEKYEQERSEIYLYDLAVDKAFRRRGIAKKLIEELKKIARDLGAFVIFVQADRADQPAINLYQSMSTSEEPLHFDITV
jgi:aminoglycoside 3-N-acetyltransferase I